jgi:ribonuclease PH
LPVTAGQVVCGYHPPPMRNDGRSNDQLRPIKVTRNFTQTPAGSVLWEQGKTIVLVTASVSQEVPPFFRDTRAGGWVTAEYVMLPGSTPQRKGWPKIGHTDSRGTEIQRLIGRSLRAVLDLSKIGPHTIALDCQVLQADGGTRTACISAAWVALKDAVAKLPALMPGAIATSLGHPGAEGSWVESPKPPARFDASYYDPKGAVVDQLAAVSVGVVEGEIRLDLDYVDDSRANVDMNVALTAGGKFVEIQGGAENGEGFDRATMNRLLDVAEAGCRGVMEHQREALGR